MKRTLALLMLIGSFNSFAFEKTVDFRNKTVTIDCMGPPSKSFTCKLPYGDESDDCKLLRDKGGTAGAGLACKDHGGRATIGQPKMLIQAARPGETKAAAGIGSLNGSSLAPKLGK